MKAVLVIDIPDKYAERYNVNEMYVWSLFIQNKQGYQMFELTTDKPNHLKPLPQKNKYDVKKYVTVDYENNLTLGDYLNIGRNECIDEITGETDYE